VAISHLDFQFIGKIGAVAEVTIDRAANVMLMDGANYAQYTQGQPYQYYGGHATVTPFRIVVPGNGLWHVVVDLGGGPGEVRASLRTIPRRLRRSRVR
jgi:Domain of unknown function (DUF1883)